MDGFMEIGFGFMKSKVFFSAVEFGVFTKLSGGKKLTGVELGKLLGLHPRGIYDFFDALVAFKILERDGDGPEGLYYNSKDAATFLDENSPTYGGGSFKMFNKRMFPFWVNLEDGLKTGEAQVENKHGLPSLFASTEPAVVEHFANAMTGMATVKFAALAEKFDFSKYQTLSDIGGSAGVLCCEVAKRHPDMKLTTCDLPTVRFVTEKYVVKHNLSSRVAIKDLDFFKDDFPKSDVITMGFILHNWDLPTKKGLIKKAFEALPKGGAFIAVEGLIDDARRENGAGLLMSLAMLIEFGGASDYSRQDFEGWTKEAGFERVESIHLFSSFSAVIAFKK